MNVSPSNYNNNVTTSNHQTHKTIKTILKIAAVIILVIAIAAVIATATSGLPAIVPLGIALSTLSIESLLLGICICCVPKKPSTSHTPTQPRRDHDPKVWQRLSSRSVSEEQLYSYDTILDILKTKTFLTAPELANIRRNFLIANWIIHDNISNKLKENLLSLYNGGSTENSILLEQPGYKNILLLSKSVNTSDEITIIRHDDHKDSSLKSSPYFCTSITKSSLNAYKKPLTQLSIYELTKHAKETYEQELQSLMPHFLPNLDIEQQEVSGIIACDMLSTDYLPNPTSEDTLIAHEAYLLGFCIAVTDVLRQHEDQGHGQKIITLVNVKSNNLSY